MTTEPLSPDLTCGEFTTLGDGDRIKVVNEILTKQGGQSSDSQAFLLSALAGILCKADARCAAERHPDADEECADRAASAAGVR